MNHAFLIVAHNEYKALKSLVSALDHPDNDIFVHIDRKTKVLPELRTSFSKVHVLTDRKSVHWGCLSLVEAETVLMECAYKTNRDYGYFHLISGNHYPLKSIDEIHSFFESLDGHSVVMPMEETAASVEKRLGRYHYLLKYYYAKNEFGRKTFRLFWKSSLRLQKMLGIRRDTSYFGGKASNWCSLTREAAGFWIGDMDKIRKRFRNTYCSDEYVAMSVLKEHGLPVKRYDRLLYQEFVECNPKVLLESDLESLLESGAMFGRKFTDKSINLVKALRNG